MISQIIKDNWKSFMVIALVLMMFIGLIAYGVHSLIAWRTDLESRYQQATQISQERLLNLNTLQNDLNISKQNAQALQDYIRKANIGQVQPVNHFYVQSPTIPQAAAQVQQRINQNDTTLPPQALERTDRTVVTPNTTQQKVDIYKINTYRNWEWSAGVGQHGDDWYIPVKLQRNFSRDAALSYERHLGGNKSGQEISYTRKTDKLLFLF